jgi:hypothetical protein
MPVTKINGVAIGGGQPGPVYRRLLAAWNDVVGVDVAGQFAKHLPVAPERGEGTGG